MKYTNGIQTHICVPVDTAIKMLNEGKNIFDCSPMEAFKALLANKKQGKQYFTGCGNEDARGMCKGHSKQENI